MSARFKTVRRARKTYKVLAPYGKPYRRHLLRGTLATILLVACRLAFPWPLRGLMEIVFQNGAPGRGSSVVKLVPNIGDPADWLVGSFVVIILLWGLSESLQRLEFTRFAVGLVRDLRATALARIPRVAATRDAGDLMAAVTGDTSRVKTGVKSILIGTSRNGAFFLGVAIIVSLIDPLIGLVFLAGGVATAIIGGLGAWRSSLVVRRARRREGVLTDDLHRYFAGTAALPTAAGDNTRKPDSKVTRIEGITTFAVHVMLAATTCAILILAIRAGRSGSLSPGAVFTILAYILLMHNKSVVFGRRIIRGGRLLPSAERVAALVMDDKPPPQTTGPHHTNPYPGGPPPDQLGRLHRNVTPTPLPAHDDDRAPAREALGVAPHGADGDVPAPGMLRGRETLNLFTHRQPLIGAGNRPRRIFAPRRSGGGAATEPTVGPADPFCASRTAFGRLARLIFDQPAPMSEGSAPGILDRLPRRGLAFLARRLLVRLQASTTPRRRGQRRSPQ